MRRLIVILLALSGCVYTIKFEKLPVVLSWGGFTPDKNLVKGIRPPSYVDGGESPLPFTPSTPQCVCAEVQGK